MGVRQEERKEAKQDGVTASYRDREGEWQGKEGSSQAGRSKHRRRVSTAASGRVADKTLVRFYAAFYAFLFAGLCGGLYVLCGVASAWGSCRGGMAGIKVLHDSFTAHTRRLACCREG